MKNLPVNQQIHAQAATENIALLNRMNTWPVVEIGPWSKLARGRNCHELRGRKLRAG